MAIEPGTSFDRYEVLSLLGVGGMGEVYLAHDTRLGRKVAFKTLPVQFTADRDRVWRFEQEARAASALNHPNIVTLLDIGEWGGMHFMTHEFVEGDALRNRLKTGRLPLAEALDIAIQTASALSAAHDAGIIHRDIKPENVMVRHDGIVKVLDFGLAKLTESPAARVDGEAVTRTKVTTDPGSVMGTPQYMSPEQARGQKVDARSDLFSLGVILYEMIAGKPPFDGVNALDLISAILQKEPAPLDPLATDAPADLHRIVSKALQKDREARYQTARELLGDLKQVKHELDLAAKWKAAPGGLPAHPQNAASAMPANSSSPGRSTRRRDRGGKWPVFVGLATLLLGGAVLAYLVNGSAWPLKPDFERFRNVKLTRVTAEGNVESVTLSPDGKYIAYSLEENGKRSLWTKHLGTGSRVQIVAPAESLGMNASTFSPDGGYVYYTRVDEQNPQGALFQVPVLGGVSKKLLTHVSQPVSLSADGRRLAFGRYHLSAPEDELLLANADGTDERRLLTVREPQWLSGSGGTWSPDGKLLAVGYGDNGMVVATVSVADGVLRPVTSEKGVYVGSVVWTPDSSGLIYVLRESVLGALQIWQTSYPGGATRRITNDLNSYALYSLALSADASSLVTVQSDPMSNIWVGPAADASRARAVTPRKNVQEGHYGLAWTPDGNVVYDSSINHKAGIWSVHADGGTPKQLTDDTAESFGPEVSADGRYITYNSTRPEVEVWRSDRDGANPVQLTRKEGGVATYSISPDSRWVVFSPFTGGIHQVSLDGGTPTELVAKGNLRYPQVSPDGRLLAYFFDDELTKRPKIGVIRRDDGAAVKTLDLPVTSGTDLYEKLFYRGFHWAPDGSALIYINTLNGVSNLWRQPLQGGEPRQITNFESDHIYNFAYSRDGSRLAFARGIHTRDAVLITDIK